MSNKIWLGHRLLKEQKWLDMLDVCGGMASLALLATPIAVKRFYLGDFDPT